MEVSDFDHQRLLLDEGSPWSDFKINTIGQTEDGLGWLAPYLVDQ